MGEVTLQIAETRLPVRFRINRRARRYVLRLASDGAAVVTVPRFGSQRQARAFAERNFEWIRRQLRKLADRASVDRSWKAGSQVLLNGQSVSIRVEPNGAKARIFLGDRSFADYPGEGRDLRPIIEAGLWRMARAQLPARVGELNADLNLPVRRVSVRNQRSRWGSCSRRGTISLNWRLVQTTPHVRDYIILHELAHLRHMNHSRSFWAEVERWCPDYRIAEAWLKQNRELLR